ncbi:PP2C family protein-serine/threonine phosphatase [Bradyrhizobium sp.]|jgi:sigma-B regulation protein RsbU (phosphoserine phosphatase)|uniref:PP2C family protein-serine/threonine phosphatase n=1 Tax=Bradyrhizobium sp. TaxID=376 RepID=UPI003C241595
MNVLVDTGKVSEPVAADRASILECTLLIADDDTLCRRLLAGILQKQGFRKFLFAEGGYSALQQIEQHQPDLVLLDMQMPDLSGLDVCKRIRARAALIDIPILMQTATVDRKQMGVMFAAGASDFLSKPINPSELIARVITHLERRCLLRELRDYRERTSAELEASRRMQLELLPSASLQDATASSTGLRIASYFRPSSEIGGDIWGMLPINDGSFGIFIADFTGHGVTAALNTFRLHALIHEYRHLHGDPSAFLSALNKRLATLLRLGQFATFLYVVIDHVAGRLRIASAGASPPMLMAGLQGSSQLVEASGAPLGIAPDMQYELHEKPFAPGSMLLLYSDGLPENPDRDGNRIGEIGLLEAIDACEAGLTPSQLVERVCAAAGIQANVALPDDTTVICVDRRGVRAVDDDI